MYSLNSWSPPLFGGSATNSDSLLRADELLTMSLWKELNEINRERTVFGHQVASNSDYKDSVATSLHGQLLHYRKHVIVKSSQSEVGLSSSRTNTSFASPYTVLPPFKRKTSPTTHSIDDMLKKPRQNCRRSPVIFLNTSQTDGRPRTSPTEVSPKTSPNEVRPIISSIGGRPILRPQEYGPSETLRDERVSSSYSPVETRSNSSSVVDAEDVTSEAGDTRSRVGDGINDTLPEYRWMLDANAGCWRCPVCNRLLNRHHLEEHVLKEFSDLKSSLDDQLPEDIENIKSDNQNRDLHSNNDHSTSANRHKTFLKIRRNRHARLERLRGCQKSISVRLSEDWLSTDDTIEDCLFSDEETIDVIGLEDSGESLQRNRETDNDKSLQQSQRLHF